MIHYRSEGRFRDAAISAIGRLERAGLKISAWIEAELDLVYKRSKGAIGHQNEPLASFLFWLAAPADPQYPDTPARASFIADTPWLRPKIQVTFDLIRAQVRFATDSGDPGNLWDISLLARRRTVADSCEIEERSTFEEYEDYFSEGDAPG